MALLYVRGALPRPPGDEPVWDTMPIVALWNAMTPRERALTRADLASQLERNPLWRVDADVTHITVKGPYKTRTFLWPVRTAIMSKFVHGDRYVRVSWRPVTSA